VSRPTDPLDDARALLRAGDFRKAESVCRGAINTDPHSAVVWQMLAAALQGQGRRSEVVDALRKAAELGPENAELLVQLGTAQAEAGQLETAIDNFQRAVKLRPDLAAAHRNLGVALAQQGCASKAAASLREAVRLKPDYSEAYYSLAGVLCDLGRRDEALGQYRKALELRPEDVRICNNLGLTLAELGRHGEAAVYLRQAIRLDPKNKEAHNNLGLALEGQGLFEQAESCFHDALRLDPAYAEAHVNLGNSYKERQRLDEAQACYDWALMHQPQSALAWYNRALALLQAGDYERGWPLSEWRWQCPSTPVRPFRQPRWDGSSLEGKTILLWCEQGLRDAIQFVRYGSLVKGRGGKVIGECSAKLQDVFATCSGLDQVVTEGEPLPDFDVQIPLLSLPAIFGTTLATVPAAVPYLHADPSLVQRWRNRLGKQSFKIGLVWQGEPRHAWDRWRSVPLQEMRALAEIRGVRLISLQYGLKAEQVLLSKPGFTVEVLENQKSFADTAAILANLDLLVSVDSAPAHLAGAMGVPVWVPLAEVSDWRWVIGREDTPWYPTLRLFRQRRLGEWNDVFDRIAGELRREVAARMTQGSRDAEAN